MQTEILTGADGIRRAIELLHAGEIVALPTETVYGLAAGALNPSGVAKIFEAKERPRFDPLILHLPNREALDALALDVSPMASRLIDTFWPGPLTLVFRKRDIVPDLVTAGLETVAVRMSAHPVFHKIISALNRPLAAPSANRFGRISPTTAQHVSDELDGRIPLIVNAGATEHGIESTIVLVANGVIEVLRWGPIPKEMLRPFGQVRSRASTNTIIAPGQLPTHYAPRTPLVMIENFSDFVVMAGKRIGALRLSCVPGGADPRRRSRPAATSPGFAAIRYLSQRRDLREAATNLFRMLRELDAENLDLIVAERVPEEGIGVAINDRLTRACNNPSSRESRGPVPLR